MDEKLLAWAVQRGYRVAWGSISVIDNVRREIEGRRSESEIEERFFERELKSVVSKGACDPARAVVLIAKPRPAHRVRFDLDGKQFETLLPPTYFRYRALFEDVRQDLVENGLSGAQVEHLTAPLKAIASRLGLVSYGRNNIGYVKGFGSYFQLFGYLTDAALSRVVVSESGTGKLLEECENCGICAGMCPTLAIVEDRLLLRAERCLTYANENPGDWPDWVNAQMHNSLVGCLECQRACPANPDLPVEDTGLAFSEIETQWLLSGKHSENDRTETGIRSKLAWLGQPYIEPVLGRNLRALVKSRGI
jgi:epoxyqueuosine reductase